MIKTTEDIKRARDERNENQEIILQYLKMAHQLYKEVLSFCNRLTEKGYTGIQMEEIPTFQILTVSDFIACMYETYHDGKFDLKTGYNKLISEKGVSREWMQYYSLPIEGSLVDNLPTHESEIINFEFGFHEYFEVPHVQDCYLRFAKEIQDFRLKTLGEYQKWLREKSMGKQKAMHVPKGNRNGKDQ